MLAASCQCQSPWVEAEEKLKDTPPLLKTPSGHVQESPLLAVVNKSLEIMRRYMSELGLKPSARGRFRIDAEAQPPVVVLQTTFYDTPPDGAGARVIELDPDTGKL